MPLHSRVSRSDILSYESAKGVRGAIRIGRGLKPAIGIKKAPCGKEITACDIPSSAAAPDAPAEPLKLGTERPDVQPQ